MTEDERARHVLKRKAKCSRHGCDGTVDHVTGGENLLRVSASNLTMLGEDGGKGFDVLVGLCGKCKRALAEGRWTPTRQADRDEWKPSEKQLHTLLMGALNRRVFKTPPEQWFFEIDFPTSPKYAKGATADLVCVLHKTGSSNLPAGIHAIEVKHADDHKASRLHRQLDTFRQGADYVWLCTIDGEPEWEEHEDVGLLYYDLKKDIVLIRRAAQQTPEEVRKRVLPGWLKGRLEKGLERVEEHVPPPRRNKRLPQQGETP